MQTPDFVEREEWKAREAKAKEEMKEAKYVEVTWTDTESCENREECVRRVQEIQNKHMDEDGQPDIKYNFLITPGQEVFVGRGWHGATQVSSDQRLPKYNECDGKTLVIAYVGRKGSKPSVEMFMTAALLATFGIGTQRLASNVELITPDDEEDDRRRNQAVSEMRKMADKMDLGFLGMNN